MMQSVHLTNVNLSVETWNEKRNSGDMKKKDILLKKWPSDDLGEQMHEGLKVIR